MERSKQHPFLSSLSSLNNPKAYGDWIWNAFAKLYTDPSTNDFNSIQMYFIDRQITHGRGLESPIDVMEAVYLENVSVKNQASYRQGIGYNFERCACMPGIIVGDILSDHIYLAGRIKAAEALDGLAKVLFSPLLIERPHLLYESLSAAIAMRNSESHDSINKATYDFADKLMQLPLFKKEYFLQYIQLMLDSEPGKRIQTLNTYGQRFETVAAEFRASKSTSFTSALERLSRRFPDVSGILQQYV